MMATHTYRPHTPASAVLSIADVLADVCPNLESTPHFLERFIGDIFPAPSLIASSPSSTIQKALALTFDSPRMN